MLGPDHEKTLESVFLLGLALSGLDRHKEAENMRQGALQGQDRVLGPDHEQTLICAHWLGLSLWRYDRSNDALVRRALEGREKWLSKLNLVGYR